MGMITLDRLLVHRKRSTRLCELRTVGLEKRLDRARAFQPSAVQEQVGIRRVISK
jgi:hypothetical protein